MSEEQAYRYDVFVSHAPADRTWVQAELLPRLEGAGLRACLDWRDFRPGASRVDEVERAVTSSRKTLLVLSPAYVDSEWAEFGNQMVQSLDPAARDLRLIPLLVAHCELPLRVRHLTTVDVADAGEAALGWRRLLGALGVPEDEAPPPPAADRPPETSGRGASVVGDGNIVITGDVGRDVSIVQGGAAPAAGPTGAGDYDPRAVRDLLLAAFTASDFRRLFLYASNAELRSLTREFSPSDGLAAMVDKAIECCQVRDLLPELLAEVQRANPRQYARFAGRLGM
jgi:hypothetical protein